MTARVLSVVMACYNEEKTVKEVVERVLESPYTAEVLIVDDGSTDGTLEVLRSIDEGRVKVFEQPINLGKGAALRRGIAEAGAQYVIIQDADFEYNPADYGIVLEPLLDGRADVVYGSRFHTNRPHRVLYYWHAIGNRALTTMSNMFTNLNLSDMETCYKAFRREVIQAITIEEDRFGFEPEITAKVASGGWSIYEVGISYSGRTYAEGKKVGWKDGVRAFWCILRYWRADPAPRRDTSFEEADEALTETLHSLDDAVNYADWITSLCAPHLGPEILEIGAGHGTMTERLARYGQVTASDLSPRCVEALEKRFTSDERVRVVEGDVGATASDGPFDAAVMINVLEHIDDDVEALRQVHQVLVPGGRAVLFVPAFEALFSPFDRDIGHRRRYRRSTLVTAGARAGFELEEVRYVNTLGAVAWWVMARRLGKAPTARGAVRLYDRVAVPVLRRLEQGRHPRFGQSLFCVLRRPTTHERVRG